MSDAEPNSRTETSTAIVTKPDPALAREIVKVRSIERAASLAAWNDYIGFAVSRLAGVTALVVGGLESLDPNLLTVVLPRPGLMVGVGLALLTGKNIVSLMARLERSNK
jgi:hypothetical protein